MAVQLLPEPEQQFLDINGAPYAGGSIAVYTPGTDTPVDTYQDSGGTVLNTNPIILDSAGRAIIWGDGNFRFVLKDADGNLIYDQVTSTTDVTTAVATETTRATNSETTLQTNITAETNRATTAENNLQTQINTINSSILTTGSVRAGLATTDSGGHIVANFSPPFVHAVIYFALIGPGPACIILGPQPFAPQTDAVIINMVTLALTNVTVQTGSGPSGGPYTAYGAGTQLGWFAVGY